jgi:hypothetical protein
MYISCHNSFYGLPSDSQWLDYTQLLYKKYTLLTFYRNQSTIDVAKLLSLFFIMSLSS